jgi:hypothetical protein
MERDMYAAAIDGSLVVQRPGVESGEELLERLGLPPHEVAARTTGRLSEGTSEPTLVELIRASGGRLPANALYRRAGYKRDEASDVERFYLDLRAACDAGTLSILGEGDATVVALVHAT